MAYYAQVRASNDEGTSPWSASEHSAPARQKPAPTPTPTPGGNSNPVFPGAAASRSVPENTAWDSNVGAAVAATDADGDALTYSLSGSPQFYVESDTGQIKVAPGASLNYEATVAYTVTVRVGDGKDAQGIPDGSVFDDAIAVTIGVTDVAEPPNAPSAPTLSHSPDNPATALEASWSEPATVDRPDVADYDLRYRAAGAAGWTSWDITGALSSATITGLNPGTTYYVQARATNDEGTSPWSAAENHATQS